MIYEWLQNIEFRNVWVLPFLGMLPVLAFLYFRTERNRHASMHVSTIRTFTVRNFKNTLLHLPLWLRLLAMGCIILALARPQTRNVQNRTRGEGIDIVLCMDVSGSMLSRDFYPDRLSVAKEVAEDFVRSGYDVQKLVRWICNSDAYQLRSTANATKDDENTEQFFARMPLKPLSAGQIGRR